MLEYSRRKKRNQTLAKLSKYFVNPTVVNRIGLLPPLIPPVELQIPAPEPEPVEALVITENSPTTILVQEKNNNTEDDQSTVKTFKSVSLKSGGSVTSGVKANRSKSDHVLFKHWQDEDDVSLNSFLSMKSWESLQSRSDSVTSRIPIRIIHGKLKARAIIAQRLPPTKPMVVFPRELLDAGDNNDIYSRKGDMELSPSQKQSSSKSSKYNRHRLPKMELVTDTSEITSTTAVEMRSKNTDVANDLSTEYMTNDSSNLSSINNTARKEVTIDAYDSGVESETKTEKKKSKKIPSLEDSNSYKSPTSSGSRLFANTAAALAKLVKIDHDKSHHDVVEHDEHVKKTVVASLDSTSRLLSSIGKVKQEAVEEEVYVPRKRKRYRYQPPRVRPPKIQPTKQNEPTVDIGDEEEEEEEYDEWSTPDGQPWCPFCTMIFRNRLALDKHKFTRQHEIATGERVEPVKEPEKIEVYEEGSHYKLLFSGQKFYAKPVAINFNMDIYEHNPLPKSNIAVPFSILEIVLYDAREDYELPRIYLDLGPRLIRVVEKLELRAKEGAEFIRKEILRTSKYGEEPDMISIREQERCRVYAEFVSNGLRLIEKEVSPTKTPQQLHDHHWNDAEHDKRTLELLKKARNVVSLSNKEADEVRRVSNARMGFTPLISPVRNVSLASTPPPEMILPPVPYEPPYYVTFESMDDPLYLKKTLNEQQFNELLVDMGVFDLFDADNSGRITLNEIDGMFDENDDGVVTLEELFDRIGRNDKLPSLVMKEMHPNLVPVQVAHTAVTKEGKAGLLALEEAFKKALEERSLSALSAML